MKSQSTNSIILVLFSLIVLHLCPAKAQALSQAEKKVLTQQINQVIRKYKLDPSHLSLQITEEHKEIFSVNPKVKKIPASITKILTSYAILKKLTPTHRFYTKLYSDGENLYLVGGGDPSFVSENMWYLVNEFTRTGIKRIKGDIVVDDTLFDSVRYDETRESTRVDRAYDAPVGAMSFNWNSVNIFVKGIKAGEKARVIVDPDNQYFDLVNNTNTVTTTPKRELTVQISNTDRLITVSGDVALSAPEKAIFKNVETPDLWSGANLKAFLLQRGIQVDGKVRTGSIEGTDAEQVAVYESKSLANIMADMNKFSNNFVAEMLTKNLAVSDAKKRATLARGVRIIREEIQKIGLSSSDVTVNNPSGLTRDNSFSAASMNVVLTDIKDDFSIFSTFNESLPVGGVDGTLRRRFKESIGEGWVRAKTGYLTGVVTLAGYAGRRDGRVLTFSFLYNGPRDEAQVREAFDQILLLSLK